MPDFRTLVAERIASLDLAPERRQKILNEWAAQLAEIYEGLRAAGLAEDEAWRELQRHVPAPQALAEDLIAQEPLAARMAERARPPLPRQEMKSLVSRIRQALTAGILRDIHAGLRLLTYERGFAATVILTLAV